VTSDPPSASAVAVGDTGPEFVVEDVQREDFVKYAGASGDFNPLHYDEPYAKAAGNESVFGQGMLTAGYVSTMAMKWFGLDAIRDLTTRFEARLWPGDTVRVTGEVVETDETPEGTTVVADLTAATDDGETLVKGSVTAALTER